MLFDADLSVCPQDHHVQCRVIQALRRRPTFLGHFCHHTLATVLASAPLVYTPALKRVQRTTPFSHVKQAPMVTSNTC